MVACKNSFFCLALALEFTNRRMSEIWRWTLEHGAVDQFDNQLKG